MGRAYLDMHKFTLAAIHFRKQLDVAITHYFRDAYLSALGFLGRSAGAAGAGAGGERACNEEKAMGWREMNNGKGEAIGATSPSSPPTRLEVWKPCWGMTRHRMRFLRRPCIAVVSCECSALEQRSRTHFQCASTRPLTLRLPTPSSPPSVYYYMGDYAQAAAMFEKKLQFISAPAVATALEPADLAAAAGGSAADTEEGSRGGGGTQSRVEMSCAVLWIAQQAVPVIVDSARTFPDVRRVSLSLSSTTPHAPFPLLMLRTPLAVAAASHRLDTPRRSLTVTGAQ